MQEFSKDMLSKRQLECLKLICLPTEEIAERMEISPTTARTHINNIFYSFGVSSRIMAIMLALKNGILTLDEVEI